MQAVHSDPTRRTAGQYARATVQRLRMRTLVTLGALAVATAMLGKTFGLHDARFLASEKKGPFADPDGAMWRLMRARAAPVWDDGALVIFPLAADARLKGSSTARP